ncbi:hypothetical protein [Brevibacillus brevis]|nr:hypothetical protein [Brevibacillus brevis]
MDDDPEFNFGIDQEIIFTSDNPKYKPIIEKIIDVEIMSNVVSITTATNL